MANNRIGIQVQVEFPSVTQIKSQLAQKWSGVKNGFTGKINVDVDQNSLAKMKTKIQSALKEKTFDIKLDSKSALREIELVHKELATIDKQLGQARELKINLKIGDMDKTFKEILENSKKVEDSIGRQSSETKKETKNLEEQVGVVDKLVRKFHEIDGKKIVTEIKTTTKDDLGNTTTRTIRDDGVTSTETSNRLADLKEIETIMKRLYQIDKDMATAEGNYKSLLKEEKRLESEQLALLQQQYRLKHNGNDAMDTGSVQALQRQQQITSELKKQREEQQGIASDVSKLAQLENQIHSIKMKQLSASDSEKTALQAMLDHYKNIQSAIQASFNAERQMTSAQKEELANLKTIHQLQMDIAKAKEKDTPEQRDAYKQVLSDLQQIHSLEMKIAEIEGRRNAGGKFGTEEAVRLQQLQQELALKSRFANLDRTLLESQNLITNATRQQLQAQQQINAQELKRVSAYQRVVANSDKMKADIEAVNSQYREMANIENNISRLQRDLIFAGMREKEVIMDQVAEERQKQEAIMASLRAQNQLTESRMREIQQIRNAQSEQLRLNEARRNAREKDQSYNDTGGLIDPYDTYQKVRQGIDAVLEPMVEIDTAFTQVRKVANASDESLQHFKDTSYDTASQLGVTADEYMKAVETWVTAGETFADSQVLAKISQVGSFVGNILPDDMVKYMSVPLKAFRQEGVDANDIINTMNQTANQNAIEMNDLGKAYMRSATTVKSAGVSFSDLTGLITGAQEATRLGGERIGTALKSVSMNYNLIKSQVTKQQKGKFAFFDSIGINLDETTSLTDALEKLHGKWKDLSDEEKTTSVFYLAGKEHANVVTGILDQWDKVKEASKEAKEQMGQGIDGSAYIEFAKQSDSLKFKLAELKNKWMELMNSIGNSKGGTMGNILDGAINSLNALVQLSHNEGLMTLLKIIGGTMVFHAGINGGKRLFDTISTGIKGTIRNGAEMVSAWKNIRRNIDEATLATERYNQAQRTGAQISARNAEAQTATMLASNTANNRNRNASNNNRGSGAVILGSNGSPLARTESEAGRATKAISGVGKALGKTLQLVPLLGDVLIALDIMGVPVFDGIAKGFSNMFKSTKDEVNEVDNLIKKFKGTNEVINGTVSKYKSNIESMKKTLMDQGVMSKSGGQGKSSGMDEKEFASFKKNFNTQAKDMGLKIRIDINDTKDILAKMKAMEKAEDALKKKANIKIAVQINKDSKGADSTEKQLKKAESDYKKYASRIKQIKELMNSMEDKKGHVKPQYVQDYAQLGTQLDRLQGKYKKAGSDVDNLTKKLDKQQKAIKDNANALLSQGKSLDLSSMKAKDVPKTIDAMVKGYKDMSKESSTLGSWQRKLGGDTEISAKAWREMIKQFPEYKNKKLEAVNSDKKLRQAIEQNITATKKEKDENLKTAESALKSAVKTSNAKKSEKKAVESAISASKKEASQAKSTANSKKSDTNASNSNAKAKKNEANASKNNASAKKNEANASKNSANAKKNEANASKNSANAKKGEANASKSNASAKKNEANASKQSANASKNHASASRGSANASKTSASASKTDASAKKNQASATEHARQKHEGLKKSLNTTPKSKEIKISVLADQAMSAIKKVKDWLSGLGNKSISVSASAHVSKKSDSVAVGAGNTGISSASVATGSTGDGAISSSVPVLGIGGAVVDASTSTTDENNSRVSEDVWRYWNTEDNQTRLESAMKSLERAITLAKDNQAQLISLYQKQISNYQEQQRNQNVLKNQKDMQLNDTLNKLKGYGFSVNTSTNTISNLSHAKDLKGTKAEEADALLSTWHSLTGEIDSINNSIADMSSSIADLKDKIEQANIQKELDGFEARLKAIDALTTSITNKDNLYSTTLGLISAEDKELGLLTNESALNQATTNMSQLIDQFNLLSKSTINYEENGTALQDKLTTLGSAILAQADNIIKYRQAINDLEFQRVTDDVTAMTTALDQNTSRIDNTVKNLQDGLLSGTDLNDLYSSNSVGLDLSRDNQFEALAKQRIALEKEVDDAETAFAQKNIDRVKGVANTTLDINKTMYNQLLAMQHDYTSGKKVDTSYINDTYGDLAGIGNLDEDYAKTAQNLENYFNDVRDEQDVLRDEYNSYMARTYDEDQRNDLTNQYIMDSMDLDVKYYKAQIQANNDAIDQIKAEIQDSSLTDDQVKARQDQITAYEQSNIDAQNKIKDTIKSRFDFEFSLMDELVTKQSDNTQKYQDSLDLITAIGGDNFSAKGSLYGGMLDSEQTRNSLIRQNISDLQDQLELYEQGSYEWNIINDEITTYNKNLVESNKSLIDMNKNILANNFSATTRDIEEKLFNGKSHDAWTTHQTLWMSGLEKELALEKMYQRMADLGTTVNKQKLDLLDKQEEVSKFEMDYLNKQLDIIELQQKVDNLNQQRTVQVLQQQADGSWDWTYQADATELEKANQDLKQAQIDLQQMEDKAKEDYLSQLQTILTNAQNGQYATVQEFQDAMEELGEAYKQVVGDIPEIGEDYIKQLVESYSQYVLDNSGVVEGTPANTYLMNATQTMTDELRKTFTDMSSELGTIFANAILAKLPNTSVSANRAITSSNTAIHIDKLEFPNATDGKGIQDAIMGLPQLALQKTKSKV